VTAASNYLENKLIDHVLRGQTFTPAATLYLALCTAAPSDSSIGTEVAGNNYARVAITSSLANWAGTQAAGSTAASSGTGGQSSNNGAVPFPTPSGSWGTVTHWALVDVSSNLYFHGALAASKLIQSGDDVSFVAGAIQIGVG